MLQQQNRNLEPPTSETNGHMKPLPAYIHKIRTLDHDQPSRVIRSHSLPQTSVHISNLHNYHYSLRPHRRETWAGERLRVFEAESVIRKSARRDSSLSSIDSSTVGTDESSEQSMTDSDTSLAL